MKIKLYRITKSGKWNYNRTIDIDSYNEYDSKGSCGWILEHIKNKKKLDINTYENFECMIENNHDYNPNVNYITKDDFKEIFYYFNPQFSTRENTIQPSLF